MPKILLIEDDRDLADTIQLALRSHEYLTEIAYDGEEGLHRMLGYSYDLVISDWTLPSMSGVEVCRQYRAQQGSTLILMLTGRSNKGDIITGLESGADDYLIKPFNMRELLSRVSALLRRSVPPPDTRVISRGALQFNPATMSVTKNGAELKLSKKELQLLALFLDHPDRTYPITALLSSVWPDDPTASEETVRTHIKTMRKKLGEPDMIANVHGKGYKLAD